MSVPGDFDTANSEIEIVKRILSECGIEFESVEKSQNQDHEDVVVRINSLYTLKTIEVKKESIGRIEKYNDLGIDFISVFHFINPEDEQLWKGPPKTPDRLQDFKSKIKVIKWGKIFYSEADIWLFYSKKNDEVVFHDWFLGSDMKSPEFIDYLKGNCKFAVNNKPSSQKSYADRYQSATFFINREDDFLLSLKKDIKALFSEEIK